jgi:hypothetical protein
MCCSTSEIIHLSPTYVGRVVVEAQRKELLAMQEKNRMIESQGSETTDGNLLCRKEDSNLHPLARTRT